MLIVIVITSIRTACTFLASLSLQHLGMRHLAMPLRHLSLPSFLFGEARALFRQRCDFEARSIILQYLMLLAVMSLKLLQSVYVCSAQVRRAGLVWLVVHLAYLSRGVLEFLIIGAAVYFQINLRRIGQVDLLTNQIGADWLLWCRQVLLLLDFIEFELELRWLIVVVTLVDASL